MPLTPLINILLCSTVLESESTIGGVRSGKIEGISLDGFSDSVFLFFIPFQSSPRNLHMKRLSLRDSMGVRLPLKVKHLTALKKPAAVATITIKLLMVTIFSKAGLMEWVRSSLVMTFEPKYPWSLSSGMYGKYLVVSVDSSQLAKKVNKHPSEIDKSSFYFVQNCGACHPGGGWGEYDRRGHLYYDEESKKFGYEDSGDSPLLDGDYTPFSNGNAQYGAPWDQSGVSEADCLICHLKEYQWKERGATLRGRFFKYGPAVGAGWADLKLSQDESGNSKVDEVIVDYAKKEVADFENLHLQIVRKPPGENCWSCHAAADGKRIGRQWIPEKDVHKDEGARLHLLSSK